MQTGSTAGGRVLSVIQTYDDDASFAMNFYFLNNPPLAVWCGFASCMSLLLFALIFYMRYHEQLRWSLYVELIMYCAAVQGVYDLIFCVSSFKNSWWTPVGARIQLLVWYAFGVMGSSFSLTIVGTVLYVVETNRVPGPKFERLAILSNFALGGFIVAANWGDTMRSGYGTNDAYFRFQVTRDATVVITVLIILQLIFRISQKSKNGNWRTSPLYLLLKRLIAYPVVQFCALSGTAYQTYLSATTVSTASELTTTSILTTVTQPLAGVGGLLAFLCMQPGAWTSLKRMLCVPCDCVVGHSRRPLPSVKESLNALARQHEERRSSMVLRHSSMNQYQHSQLETSLSVSEAARIDEDSVSGSIADGSGASEVDYEYTWTHDEYDELELSLEYTHRENIPTVSHAVVEMPASIANARPRAAPLAEIAEEMPDASNEL